VSKNSNVKNSDGLILIDSPVGPFSNVQEILAWIEELKTMPDRPEVRVEIERAEFWFGRRNEEK